MMRKFVNEPELKKLAEKISENIVIREYKEGSSCDTRRTPTSSEKDILSKIACGALLTLNCSEINRKDPNVERAIVDCAEYIVRQFIPKCNGYDSMYNPLNNALEEWEKEAE